MTATSFLDIVGDDQIDAIVDDLKNLTVSAFRAEGIHEWIPDTGQYIAKAGCRMRNGVFRTPVLAQSGLPAQITHRFHAEDAERRMTGTCYVGIVIYDSDKDDYTFTIREGADVLGIIRPWRHDNRRHLLVIEQPAENLLSYIPFVIRTEGRGPCYLESFVFMRERPAPSTFAPGIHRLSAQVEHRTPGAAEMVVHFITSQASKARVSARLTAEKDTGDAKEEIMAVEESFEALHVIRLSGLRAGEDYTLRITAEERGGATEQRELQINTGYVADLSDESLEIPIEICASGTPYVEKLPLTFGLPVREGVVHQLKGWSLQVQGECIPLQARVTSRWADGSARWLLFDAGAFGFTEQIAAEGSGTTSARVLYNPHSSEMKDGLSVYVEANDPSSPEQITVRGTLVQVTVSARRQPFLCIEKIREDGSLQEICTAEEDFYDGRLASGLKLHAGPIADLEIAESGPERAVIKMTISLVDERGVEHLRSTLKAHIYAQQPFVRLSHRLVVTSPALAPAYSQNDGYSVPPQYAHVLPAMASETGRGASLLCVEQLALRFHGAGTDEPLRIFQPHDQAYSLEQGNVTVETGHRWEGPLALGDLAVCVKDFWQTAPNGLAASEEGWTFELFPALPILDWPQYDEEWWRLYFWLDRERRLYKLKTGMAFSSDLLIGLSQPPTHTRDWQHWLNGPAFVRPQVAYLNSTRALLPIAPKEGSTYPQYEQMMDRALENWYACREEYRHYGFLNFGDTYNEGEGWANNEYDAAFAHILEFLRGGKPGWALLAAQHARHMADIDTCNYSTNPQDVGKQYTHTQGHTGSYLPSNFRSKNGESQFQPSHSWIEGLVILYLLTGDETLHAAALGEGERYTEGLRHYDFNNMRESGWHLIHLCGLARLDADPRYLNAAAVIVERVLDQQEPGGGWEHPLSQAHCLCPPPRCRGEAGFMVGVMLSGLRRFYELDSDPRVAQAITGGARWLVRRTYISEAGLFRYTSCPNHNGPRVFYTMMVVEGLAEACAFTQDPVVMDALQHSLAVIGAQSVSPGQAVRYGKDLLIEVRYIPTMLAILQKD